MLNRFQFPVLAICTLVGLLLVACGGGTAPDTSEAQEEDELGTSVAETLTAVPLEATTPALPTDPIVIELSPEPTSTPEPTETPDPTDTPTPTQLPYNVSGEVCYPDGEVPAMTAYFEETDNEALTELPIDAGQTSYEVKLPPGTYIAYAWLSDFSRGGLYSKAVSCGLGEECEDHTLLPFTITEGELLTGIDLCDWFAGPFNVPYPPGKEQSELTGRISGAISEIDGELPGLRVVAFNLDTNYWYWASTQPEQAFYTISELPPGTYHVVAYDEDGRAGGHANADHDLIEVTVSPGSPTEGADINDWTAPEGTFPEDPTR